MFPLLKYISDGKEYKMRAVTDELAIQFGVSEEEKKELLPSGAAAEDDENIIETWL